MNIIRYLSKKIKSKLKRIKLYTAAVVLTITTATTGVLTACTSKTNNSNSKNATEVVTEIPEEKEDVIETFKKSGIILEQDENYEGYYKIIKSSVNNSFTTGINDYFPEKGIVPVYDLKCSPEELAELLRDLDTGYDDYTYGAISLGSAFSYNKNFGEDSIGNNYREKMFNLIYDDTHNRIYSTIPKEILAYNLMNLKIEEVHDQEKYYSRFDPIKCYIYINKNYVNTPSEEEFALLYAIINAGLTAYVNVDNRREYCSLTDYYYDSKNKKLLEVGKTYQDLAAYGRAYNPLTGYKDTLSEDHIKKMYSVNLATGLLASGFGEAPIKDFSRLVEMIVDGNNTRFPDESKEIDIADILLRVDAGDTDALKEAIDYYKLIRKNYPQYNGAPIDVGIRGCFLGSDVETFTEELVEYATKEKSLR